MQKERSPDLPGDGRGDGGTGGEDEAGEKRLVGKHFHVPSWCYVLSERLHLYPEKNIIKLTRQRVNYYSLETSDFSWLILLSCYHKKEWKLHRTNEKRCFCHKLWNITLRRKKSQEKFLGREDVFVNNNLSWPKSVGISFSFANCLQFTENHYFLPA